MDFNSGWLAASVVPVPRAAAISEEAHVAVASDLCATSSRESDSGGPHPIGPLQPERAVSGRVEWRLSHLTGAHTGAHRAHTPRFAGKMPRNLRSRKPLWAISVHRGFESLPPPLT